MRILMIIDGLPGGGAEKVVLTLAAGLVARQHQVSLFSLRDVCEYPMPEGVDYQTIVDHSRAPWRKLTELRRRAAMLDKAIQGAQAQQGPFDLVLSNLHKTDRIVARSRALNPDKVWFCLHGMFSPSYLGHRTGLSRWLKRVKIQQVYQQRNIVAVSQAVLSDLQSAFQVRPSNAAVINNPFDFAAIAALADQPCERAGTDYLVHVGRFHPNKRHDRLIRAYALSGIEMPLVLLGKGRDEEVQRIRQLAVELGVANRVIFQGFCDNPYPYIRHARLLVLSSDSEGFGNVLVEALSCGTPVVSTRCPGGPEEILTGPLAQGLAELSADSLAETLKSVLASPPAIDKSLLERYRIDSICAAYLALGMRQPSHLPSR
ncbi:glycosyltransferase [Lonsdalea populi]|uniref:glycosyltransferase n=1 Tax=Lonsdalea populi TaxID=1172565 RepID=UPI000A228DB4|nr:glycosyltransferase [Lonsdalea populi]OSM97792.1 glycosyl transferase [Lonsdalea populi]RAT73172.1 glycosyl transferase [Lonsdalea populi]RAT74068.1 glycosyl transferase [Lonsdalea populi]RAT77610.1 glycosyl transferase [Lonsdalea populi]RAT79873.1 glycosyl transferase [Lonsdalea populi]